MRPLLSDKSTLQQNIDPKECILLTFFYNENHFLRNLDRLRIYYKAVLRFVPLTNECINCVRMYGLPLRVSMLRWRFIIFVYSFSDDVSRFTTLWLKFVASVDDGWSFWLRSSGDCLFIYFQPRKGVAKSPQQNTQTAQNSVTSAFDRQWILHRFVLINVKCRL